MMASLSNGTLPIQTHTCGINAERSGHARYYARISSARACSKPPSQNMILECERVRKGSAGAYSDAPSQTRRRFILSQLALLGFVGTVQQADAEEQLGTPQPVQAAKGLIEDLLEKSRQNKTKNDKDRLESYYRRNYKDWFDVEKGNFDIGNTKNQLSKELQQEILQWIEKNKGR